MSTRFQASARLSWSGADAFVPGMARNRVLVTPCLDHPAGSRRGREVSAGFPGRLSEVLEPSPTAFLSLLSDDSGPRAKDSIFSKGCRGEERRRPLCIPTRHGLWEGQRRDPVTLGPSHARGLEPWDCPDVCLARPMGAATPNRGCAEPKRTSPRCRETSPGRQQARW